MTLDAIGRGASVQSYLLSVYFLLLFVALHTGDSDVKTI